MVIIDENEIKKLKESIISGFSLYILLLKTYEINKMGKLVEDIVDDWYLELKNTQKKDKNGCQN